VTVKKVGYMGGTKGIYIGMRPHFTFPRESTFPSFFTHTYNTESSEHVRTPPLQQLDTDEK
jgi:hypothetical protein